MKPSKGDHIEYSVALLGGGGAGKSSFVTRLLTDEFEERDWADPTLLDEYFIEHSYCGRDYHITLLDTAGQEQYAEQRREVVQSCQGYLLLFDLTQSLSFEEIEVFFNEVCRMRCKDTEDLPIVVLGSKADLVDERAVSRTSIRALELKNGVPVIEISACDGTNVRSAIDTLVLELDYYTKPGKRGWLECLNHKKKKMQRRYCRLDRNSGQLLVAKQAEKKADLVVELKDVLGVGKGETHTSFSIYTIEQTWCFACIDEKDEALGPVELQRERDAWIVAVRFYSEKQQPGVSIGQGLDRGQQELLVEPVCSRSEMKKGRRKSLQNRRGEVGKLGKDRKSHTSSDNLFSRVNHTPKDTLSIDSLPSSSSSSKKDRRKSYGSRGGEASQTDKVRSARRGNKRASVGDTSALLVSSDGPSTKKEGSRRYKSSNGRKVGGSSRMSRSHPVLPSLEHGGSAEGGAGTTSSGRCSRETGKSPPDGPPGGGEDGKGSAVGSAGRSSGGGAEGNQERRAKSRAHTSSQPKEKRHSGGKRSSEKAVDHSSKGGGHSSKGKPRSSKDGGSSTNKRKPSKHEERLQAFMSAASPEDDAPKSRGHKQASPSSSGSREKHSSSRAPRPSAPKTKGRPTITKGDAS